jgi:hypothetical protein
MAALLRERDLRPMTEFAITAHVNTALKKALDTGLYQAVHDTGDHYLVPSTTRGGEHHLVRLTPRPAPQPPEMSCSCEAGQFLPFCVHRAAVTIHRWTANGYDVEVGPRGQVERVLRQPAARLAYDPFAYEALIQDTPPVASYEEEATQLAPEEGEWHVVTAQDTAPRPVRRRTALDRD